MRLMRPIARSRMSNPDKQVAIVGGGPAGLMAAEVIAQAGVQVDLYDAMPSVGRKFLLAGKGGLNITHSEPLDAFISRYGARSSEVAAWLAAFSPQDLCEWVHALGVQTFVGSSGRVFPTEMKAAPLLRAWLHRLRGMGVRIHVRHRWLGWDAAGQLRFATPDGEITQRADAQVLALGGASWARLGSDGAWVPLLQQKAVAIAPLQPANCGFDSAWSAHFSERFAGHPLKAIAVRFPPEGVAPIERRGEFVITQTGIEGSLIYAISAALRDTISRDGQATFYLDLLPDHSPQRVLEALQRPRGADSMANHLRRKLGIDGVKAGLLRECADKADYTDLARLATVIKALPITVHAPRPIDEAISSAGGVSFAAMDEHLMISSHPGLFCAGEMLDWEAPTGGYLLTACMASGRIAGAGVLRFLGVV